MVKYLSILLLAFSASASNVLVFSTNSTPVAGRALVYLLSVDTGLYLTRADVLINPTLPNHPLDWCKVSGGVVLAMSTAESNSIVAARAASDLASRQARETSAKLDATNTVELSYHELGRIIRAVADTTRSEINILRAEVTFLRMELNKAKVNITSWRGEAAFATNSFTPRTAVQMRNAIIGEINSQPNTAP